MERRSPSYVGLGGRAFQAKETGRSKALRQESHWQVGKGKTNELGMVSQRENGRRRGREVARGRFTQGTVSHCKDSGLVRSAGE